MVAGYLSFGLFRSSFRLWLSVYVIGFGRLVLVFTASFVLKKFKISCLPRASFCAKIFFALTSFKLNECLLVMLKVTGILGANDEGGGSGCTDCVPTETSVPSRLSFYLGLRYVRC